MTKAIFKAMPLNEIQARACMRHNRRETVTKSIEEVKHLVTEGNEQVVYETYDKLIELISFMPKKPHGNAKIFREAVITTEKQHGIEDLIALGVAINNELGYTPMYIFLHRDEGFVERATGNFIPNRHAHMGYTTVDFKTGRAFPHGRPEMIKLQNLTAEYLEMERGIPVKDSKRVDYDHHQWRALNELISVKDHEIEILRKRVELLENVEVLSNSSYSHSMFLSPIEYYLDWVDVSFRKFTDPAEQTKYFNIQLKTIAKTFMIVKEAALTSLTPQDSDSASSLKDYFIQKGGIQKAIQHRYEVQDGRDFDIALGSWANKKIEFVVPTVFKNDEKVKKTTKSVTKSNYGPAI